ncbi:hypothetical protein [Chitinophaga tropicalis]|uniref:Uncharacterized protein n=1 Tax=Chitinophaga tropicalis TaxID=2683588 RepID=A0A7K1U2I1_9BACT|nr:hypothetical protein [Chitinophaga tropicalis]MVT08569.1 hypothetical protein [Chitinophaga tropicalis]
MEKSKIISSKISGAINSQDKNTLMSVIINVKEANYVPDWLKIRNKITSFIFTSEVKKADLIKLEKDQQIISVSLNQRLNMIK